MISAIAAVLVFAQKVKWQGSYLQTACVRLAAAVFVVLPTLSFFGWWPSYLSMSLYSGNTTRAGVIFDSSSAPQFAAPLERVVLQRSDTQREIALVDWSFSILRVPPFPEHAALRDAAQQLCRQYHLENANVEISHRLLLFGSNARVEKVRCIE